MVAENEEVLGQDDFADHSGQKIVRKILKSCEQDVEDALDDVAAAVPTWRSKIIFMITSTFFGSQQLRTFFDRSTF